MSEDVKPDFSNLKNNQKKKKDKSGSFNEFSSITILVKKYKESGSNEDLVAILEALSGLINSFTLIICPGDLNQQIFITPYMKKLLGMFLSKQEQASGDPDMFNVALARVRWIMRRFTYEDIYAHLLLLLMNVVKSLRIIGDCDCFYYIQWVMKFKVHKYILDQTKDVTINIADISTNPNNTDGDETFEEILGRLSYEPENSTYEDKVLDKYYEFDSINILIKKNDLFKCFSYYEKYLIYLYDVALDVKRKPKDTDQEYLDKKYKMISQLLKYETVEEIKERYEDIHYKIKLIMEEKID